MTTAPRSSLASRSSDDAGAEKGNLFRDVNRLRKKEVDHEALEHAKFNNSWFGQLAKNKYFEITTLSIISLNAVCIGYDADYTARWGKEDNLYDGPWGFVLAENFFCSYFFFEVLIRFCAFKKKCDATKDAWFVFDTILVLFMVLETWLMPVLGGGSFLAQFSVLRLLRLLRITRMARLMRSVPELMTIVKGMAAAVRSVGFVAILQGLVVYIFAIIFTTEYHQGLYSDGEILERMDSDDPAVVNEATIMQIFGSMGKSMFSLFIMGTILDDVTLCTDAIRRTGNTVQLVCFLIFIVLSSFTMLNMLVGILVEVVQAVAEGEKQKNSDAFVKDAIVQIFDSMDRDGSGLISKDEFCLLGQNKDVINMLQQMDIKEGEFIKYATLLFKPDPMTGKEPSLDLETIYIMLLRLRGTFINSIDFESLKSHLLRSRRSFKQRLVGMEHRIAELRGQRVPEFRLLAHDGVRRCDVGALRPSGLLKVLDVREAEEVTDRVRRTASLKLLTELQRRSGIRDLTKTGLPRSLMDNELLTKINAAWSLEPVEITLDEEPPGSWPEEVLVC